ncbi:sugar ABC transporter permease [Microtetraspora sp. NBRC 13810]|uniref:carbohydrate ABC transporter permease n=1 Tax=Microtetraspora sp. NBRC 13810 TaxID=3030990 RepID=UPI0024A5C402|nr:sugar ABC transporter permease [Microtetraspora sp. NBRC 13810]GLW07996.1 sugar ABC transporter permease [Microtetraspora sp. NBRC 13810]
MTLTRVTHEAVAAGPDRRRRPPPRSRALPYLLLLPAALGILGTLVYPVVQLVALSFQRQNLADLIRRTTTWVGLDNYLRTLTDPQFWTILPRTIAFALVCVTLTLVIGTLCALLLKAASPWARLALSSGLVVAWATPVFIGAVIWRWLFDSEFGVVNYLLTRAGLCDCRGYGWFLGGTQATAVLVVIVVWGAVPFVALSVYGGLLTVPAELHEAARVDGASGPRVFWRITLPLLRPVYVILIVLSLIWDMKVFPQIWFTTKGGPYESTVMLGVYIYNKGINASQFGAASSIAVLMTLMLLGLAWFYIRTLRQEAR